MDEDGLRETRRFVEQTDFIDAISPAMRKVVQEHMPDLVHRLPRPERTRKEALPDEVIRRALPKK